MYSSHASPVCFPWAAPGAFICILLSSNRVARTLVLTQGGQTRSSPHSIFRQLLSFARPNSNVGSQSDPVDRPLRSTVSRWPFSEIHEGPLSYRPTGRKTASYHARA